MLEWIDERPRLYVDVIDVWRTNCPRMSIWEDACIDGLIDCSEGPERIVTLTTKGRQFLNGQGP